jgi:hypothetical protein
MTIPGAAGSMSRLGRWARRWADWRKRAVRIAATAMSLAGVGLLIASSMGTVFAYAASSSKTAATDSCGYPNSSSARSATVFNENTVIGIP